jgi:hypothetical protein
MSDSKAVQDVLEAINTFSDHTEEHFKKLKQEFKQDLAKLETKIVTKDYLDEKLADLRGDLVVLTRKEDRKFLSLVGILQNKKIISEAESKMIFAMEPFGQ